LFRQPRASDGQPRRSRSHAKDALRSGVAAKEGLFRQPRASDGKPSRCWSHREPLHASQTCLRELLRTDLSFVQIQAWIWINALAESLLSVVTCSTHPNASPTFCVASRIQSEGTSELVRTCRRASGPTTPGRIPQRRARSPGSSTSAWSSGPRRWP